MTPFGDWRIRLGITLGVLVFSAGVIAHAVLWPTGDPIQAQNVSAAWWALTLITGAMLGFSALSDRGAQRDPES